MSRNKNLLFYPLGTTSLSPTSQTHNIGHIFTGIMTIIVFKIFACNSLVLVIFFKMKKTVRRKVSNLLLVDQAFVDILIGATAIPRIVCLEVCIMTVYKVTIFFTSYTMYFAVGILITCTLERYMSVKIPLFHHVHATAGKITCLILFIAVITLAPGFVNLLLPVKVTLLRNLHIGEGICLCGGILLIFALLGATYRSIRYSIQSRITMIKSQAGTKKVAKNEVDPINRERQKKLKTIKVFLLMSIIYTITIVPHIAGEFLLCIIRPSKDVVFLTKTIVYICYISSSAINPCLTLRYKPDYKNVVLKIITNIKEGRPEASI